MAYAHWAAMYYPVEAKVGCNSLVTALTLSILKYSGSSPTILKQYNLLRRSKNLQNNRKGQPSYTIYNSEHCHLCEWAKRQRHIKFPDDTEFSSYCLECPLPLKCGAHLNSPWAIFIDTGDNQPIITALIQALANNNIDDLVSKQSPFPELFPFKDPEQE